MPATWSPEEFSLLREELRGLRPPFLLHAYEATEEDYEQITDEDLKCEFIDGELIVHSPASLDHEDLTAFVIRLLGEFVAQHRLGRVFGSNAVMQLGRRRFSPDVSVLLASHYDRVRRTRVVGPMDLVAEIISESTRSYDHETKLPLYREGQVGEIWMIDRERRQFEVHALREGGYVSQVLPTGRWSSTAVPGLTIQVDWFWADPLPAVRECRLA
jgi:Uma2 family endonuclease